MPSRRFSRRPLFPGARIPRLSRSGRIKLSILLVLAVLVAVLTHASLYLRKVSSEIAMSDAQDVVTLAVNEAISQVITEGGYGYEDFVTLEKDTEGNITAVSTNMARVNVLATALLSRVAGAADSGRLDIRIPLGNLSGSSLLLGKGPDVPVEIIMLTSSTVDYYDEFESAGINQTKHRLLLKVDVDVDILIPWATLSTRVETDVIIAETLIVGKVPGTYVDLR